MAKKSAISGEYIIQVEDSGSVVVYRIYDNVKGGLREIASILNLEYDNNWTTRQLGTKILQNQGEKTEATIGEYVIAKNSNGSIELYKKYNNVIDSLRCVAKNIGFDYDEKWNTRFFGSKIIDYINSNK